MTTFEHARIGAATQRRRGSVLGWVLTRSAPTLGAALGVLRPLLLTLVALGCFTAAAFMWHVWVGLIVVGLSALVVDFKLDLDAARRAR